MSKLDDKNPQLVNGTSYFSLTTNNKGLFKKTADFYSRLGFISSSSSSTEKIETILLTINSNPFSTFNLNFNSKLKEEVKIKDSCSPSIKLILNKTNNNDNDDDTKKIEKKINEFKKLFNSKKDWRIFNPSIVLYTPNIDTIYQTLEKLSSSSNIPIFAKPTELTPIEIYTIDPLGNLIGFTSLSNPFKETPPPYNVFESFRHRPSIASISNDIFDGINNKKLSKNIAIMTSGGDSPGMNSVVRAVVRTCITKGCKPYAICEGYEGLVQGGKLIKEMKWQDVSGWLAEGGTNIGTARCQSFRERPGRLKAAKNMIRHGIDALIVCGGDGSLTGADMLRSDWPDLIKELHENNDISDAEVKKFGHLTICGLVGSIDNDMALTDFTIGAVSSLHRICEAIDYIDATANSHSRAFVIEVMGRHCGWLALMAGIATSADYIFIPEHAPKPSEWRDDLCDDVSINRKHGKRKSIIIVAEGAIDDELNPITSDMVKDVLVERLGLDTRVTTLGHVQRGGTAAAYDRVLASIQAVEAVQCVLESNPSIPSQMISIINNSVSRVPLMNAVKETKQVATAIENKDFKKAISLRSPDFIEQLKNFKILNTAINENKRYKHLHGDCLKIAIVNIGAPAGGMNAANRAAAVYCLSRGHKPYGIYNGFSGLTRHESIRELSWLEMEDWASLGGSEIGTNRDTPLKTDIGMIAYYFKKYQIDGLVIVGGFEAFASLEQLESHKDIYNSFNIPMVVIPCTLSNNVPGTEASIGNDTCLNALINSCDVIKLSASATTRRVFVVEVQGGNCGYVATYGGLICGAISVYTPEQGIDLKRLESDIKVLNEAFDYSNERYSSSGKMIIASEKTSKVFTTDVIANLIKEESKGRYDCRTAVLGHGQQGTNPSPLDRINASRLTIRGITFIENHYNCKIRKQNKKPVVIDHNNGGFLIIDPLHVVIGVESGALTLSSVRQLWDFETDSVKRCPKHGHWNRISQISNILAGRGLQFNK